MFIGNATKERGKGSSITTKTRKNKTQIKTKLKQTKLKQKLRQIIEWVDFVASSLRHYGCWSSWESVNNSGNTPEITL
jgi:hypothetical protein